MIALGALSSEFSNTIPKETGRILAIDSPTSGSTKIGQSISTKPKVFQGRTKIT